MKEKYIVREVSPEATDFSFYFDNDGIKEAGGDYCYNLFIVTRGRLGLEGFQIDEYNEIVKRLDWIEEEFTSHQDGTGAYKSYKGIMEDYGLHYTPNACHALKELIFSSDFNSEAPETVAAFLTIKTGRPWAVAGATGYSQGDYCEIVYCEDFHKNPRAYGEIWLGAGREFCVIDLDDDGNEIDSCYGYIVADCEAWTDAEYKKLVCSWAGIPEEETRLEMVDGYTVQTVYSYRTA